MTSASRPLSIRCPVAVLAATVMLAAACATAPPPAFDHVQLDDAIATLNRPLPRDLAALYGLRVPKASGLRLTVLTAGDEGRMTVTKPFGEAASLTAWSGDGPTIHFDMEQGCRSTIDDLRAVLGLGAIPLEQAVLLLGGRLPAATGDEVAIGADSSLEIRGAGWGATVRLAAEPWRVLELRELDPSGEDGWRIELAAHARSIPGRVMVVDPDGRKIRLELKRLEWPQKAVLPPLPDFPSCGS